MYSLCRVCNTTLALIIQIVKNNYKYGCFALKSHMARSSAIIGTNKSIGDYACFPRLDTVRDVVTTLFMNMEASNALTLSCLQKLLPYLCTLYSMVVMLNKRLRKFEIKHVQCHLSYVLECSNNWSEYGITCLKDLMYHHVDHLCSFFYAYS